MEKKILQSFGIAILGLGRAGTIHFGNCLANKRVILKYLVEVDAEKRKEYATFAANRLYGIQILEPSQLDVVLSDPEVHGVIITTITSVHEELTLKCLQAGKAVFCEKPLAETYEGTEKCYKEAERHKVPLFCAFNRRFDPAHSKVRSEVKSGKVGQLQVVKTCSRDSPSPPIDYLKASPGIFHDCGIHDIDLIMWIVGEKPTTVYTQAHAFRKDIAAIDDVDTVAITMKFPSGVLAMIDLSRFAAYGYDQRLEAFGSKGMVESKNLSKSSFCLSNGSGISDDVIQFSFQQRFAESYEIELDHFLDSINGEELIVTKDSTLAACKVAQACEDSCKSGETVKLTWA
eukprot:Seg382.13 transcript_id=Seg382.13/GoldUCD/mRNA.D3Y31 product="Myo-inositol 2-dehydrogenase" protein_id=Seg382.13/GoldUCD/D3Y31